MGYFIRAEKSEDIAGISETNIQAFNKEDEATLVELIRQSDNFIPELSLVAENQESEIIGHILFSKITILTGKGEKHTLGLAPMAVKPAFQNQGIGSALVKEGLKACKAAGFSHVFVLGHPNFYPRFGFIPSNHYEIEPPFPVRSEVFMAIELEKGSLDGIHGKIVYPPAFNAVK